MIKSLKKKQGGFTLIELMVVIVIIGILVAIALPNFIGAQDRAKISSVKANMHTFQTIAETYAVDWGGVYANNVSTMSTEAITPGRAYWKDFTNPFSSTSGNTKSYSDMTTSVAGTATVFGASVVPGIVLYNAIGGSSATKYFVYGANKAGQAIVDKGTVFMLTNS
jgi:prepilin-type N-terminal cleavage/methylation domain-containing protein